MTAISISKPGAFDDGEMKSMIDMYRQVVTQRYTPCGPQDMERMLVAPPFYVSRKIDGELWFLRISPDGSQLIAANGRVMTGDAPVLAEAPDQAGTVLAGELHVPKADARERVGDVPAALTADAGRLCFAAFDVIEHAGTSWRDMTYAQRLEILRDILPTSGTVHAVPVTTVSSPVDVAGLYQDLVETTGAEGLVVRCGDGRILKVKPEITLDLAVLGFTTRDGAGGEEVRSLLIGLHVEDSTWVPLGTVGNMAEGISRRELLDLVLPLEAPSNYRKAASSGQLYRMIRPELIVECTVLDVQAYDSKDSPIRQPRLNLTDDGWGISSPMVAATVINPVVQRLRADKVNPREGDRWQQIETLVAPQPPATVETGEVEVIRRQVWTKTSKDKTDVRKLVVWKTNRDEIDPSYPVYVVQWTDYSAGRKTPLTREVRPAMTQDSANELAEALVADNIKKGWELKP
jgi:hypothetical protein